MHRQCPECQSELSQGLCNAGFCPCGHPPYCQTCGTQETLAPGIDYFCNNKECPDNKLTSEDKLGKLFKENNYISDETHADVFKWGKDTFPEWGGRANRALAIIEEAVELGKTTGLSDEQILATVQVVFRKATIRKDDELESDRGELADVYINVISYAGEVGYKLQDILNEKMKVNRSKSLEHYKQKAAQKLALGMILRKEAWAVQPLVLFSDKDDTKS